MPQIVEAYMGQTDFHRPLEVHGHSVGCHRFSISGHANVTAVHIDDALLAVQRHVEDVDNALLKLHRISAQAKYLAAAQTVCSRQLDDGFQNIALKNPISWYSASAE